MKLIKFLILGVSVLIVIHCREESPVKAADLVLINGNIVTVDKNNPRAEALAVKGDTIVAIGSYGDNCVPFDCQGFGPRIVFIHSHNISINEN